MAKLVVAKSVAYSRAMAPRNSNAASQRAHAFPDPWVTALARALSNGRPSARARPYVVGISGLQGSGKSTLARQLARALRWRGLRTQSLSLDDFYLGRRARTALAKRVHPLFATRGVPGTHDIARLRAVIAAWDQAQRRVRLPRFRKDRDTRVAPSRERCVAQLPEVVLLEGWCVGVPAQAPAALRTPINALERKYDRDGRWRRAVNTALARDYAPLWRRLDALIWLRAPSFASAQRWRDAAERPLRARRAARAQSRAQLRQFMQYFERLSRHSLRCLPKRATQYLRLDAQHRVRTQTLTAFTN